MRIQLVNIITVRFIPGPGQNVLPESHAHVRQLRQPLIRASLLRLLLDPRKRPYPLPIQEHLDDEREEGPYLPSRL